MEFTIEQKQYLKQKCYFLTLVTYLSNVDKIIAENTNKIKKYAYAYHDKDDNKPHTHIILAFFSDQTLMKYAKLFNTTEVKALEKKDLKPMFDYLIHDTTKCRSEGKYLYPESVRVTNDFFYFSPHSRVKLADNIPEMLDDVTRLSRRSFACKYGFNAIIHYDCILRFALQCAAEDLAIAHGQQINLLTSSFIVNQLTGELINVEQRKISKILSKHLTPTN